MSPDVYEMIRDLAVNLANCSEREDTQEYWSQYHQLENICTENENGENDHPFQWETLADFTIDNNSALKIYVKALELAQSHNLSEYSASVTFAMAERYSELGDKELALSAAHQANAIAKQLEDLELRKAISEFLLNESQ